MHFEEFHWILKKKTHNMNFFHPIQIFNEHLA